MSADLAVKHYLGKEGYKKLNCAQSVSAAFEGKIKLSDAERSLLASCGGGRAPGGICGALHAAQLLLAHDPDKLASCRADFLATAGSLQCREIRAGQKLSCAGCVEKAARHAAAA